MGMLKNIFKIYRQFGHALSKSFASPGGRWVVRLAPWPLPSRPLPRGRAKGALLPTKEEAALDASD